MANKDKNNLQNATPKELEIRRTFVIYGYNKTAELLDTTPEEINSILSRLGAARASFAERTQEWKDEVTEYYQTHSLPQTCMYYFTARDTLLKLIEERNLPIRTRSEELRLSRINHYGSWENYVDTMNQHTVETCQRLYGVDNGAQTDQAKQHQRETFTKNYGVDNVMKSDVGIERFKSTFQEKYGVDWPMQDKNILQKGIDTYTERYGGRGWASESVMKKSKETFERNYGCTHWRGSEELTAKLNERCMNLYGVEWPCMTEACRNGGRANSHVNQAFGELLFQHGIEYTTEFGIQRRSYDFKVGNILIEINPAPTHNSTLSVFGDRDTTPPDYHYSKTKLAVDNGFRCINIWDWDSVDLIIKLLEPKERIYARKCDVREVSIADACKFINDNHLQGYAKDSIRLGLYYNNELVSVMTFGKPRYNKNYEYELIRYCSSHKIVGGAQKLFKHFVDSYQPSSMISYCDLSKFTGDTYTKLGFELKGVAVSKHWFNMKTKKHITDNLLRQRGFDQLLGSEYGCFGKGTSNEELMKQHGFLEIYDAGQATYIYKKL